MSTVDVCPVCDETLIVDRDYIDFGILCEASERCPNGCYEYDYAYGTSVTRIGPEEWVSSYTQSQEEWNNARHERAEVVAAMKGQR